jgi:hypothetical protein
MTRPDSPFTPLQAGLLVGGLLVALLAGCHRGVDKDAALAQANSTNIQRLANLYLAYQSDNEWRGPADEAKFKAYLHAFDPKRLQRVGVDPQAIDALFTSERDGQPYKIRYGVRGSARGSAEPVIFESAGVNGKYEVALLNMTQREVDKAEYDALWNGKAKAPNALRTK